MCVCVVCVWLWSCTATYRGQLSGVGCLPLSHWGFCCCCYYFVFGSHCSLYSRLTGFGIPERFSLPSHWRRVGGAEICHHIGSGDQTLVLRLSISQTRIMIVLWVKSSEVMPWRLILKPASHNYKSTHLLSTCYSEIRKYFFSFKSPMCAWIHLNLQVHLVYTHWKSHHLARPQFLHLWNRITTYLANPWEG